MQIVALYLDLQHKISIFALVYARLAIVFYMLPVLGEKLLSNLIVKNSIISLVIIGLWPCIGIVLSPEQGWFLIFVKELLAGLILSVSLCIPFWIVVNMGEILDNQRGATISESIDPINGAQSSTLSGFLNFTFGAIFFSNHGMQKIIYAMKISYDILPFGSELSRFNWQPVGTLLMTLAEGSIMLAAPVMIIMMLSEVLLGVFSRYCPQLNPFSLSLTIKSFIAFLTFLLYGLHAMSEKPIKLFSKNIFEAFFL